ncbi:MAG: cation diffusion facilitator family transporter [Acidimicrobiia bacterium]|nr:cation diffusion facilitator family transporter [Acidimicrobiia bacterium]
MTKGHTEDDHPHDHPVGSRRGALSRRRRLSGHTHDRDAGPVLDTGRAGLRAAQVSLFGLGITALAQAIIVAFTGSVALLSDTLHNLTDAATSIPLWIAFAVGRRTPTTRFTFGMNRAEDLAGVVIVAAIALSAAGAVWQSIGRLLEPSELDHIPWVFGAGVVGGLGNELVARYRMRVGRRIGSAALVADGQHARADALTSLAVVAAGVGAWLGADWIDPVAGLLVATMILVMLRRAAGRVFGRLMDAVDPELVASCDAAARSVDGVVDVRDLRLRWHGHRLLAMLTVAVDAGLTVGDGHRIAQEVAHAILHEVPHAAEAFVHVDPADDDHAHALTEHHRGPPQHD